MNKPSEHTVKWAINKLREYALDDKIEEEKLRPLLYAWDSGNKEEFFALCRGVLPFYCASNIFIEELLDYARSLVPKTQQNHYEPLKSNLALPQVAGRVMTMSHADFERGCLVCLAKEQDKADGGDNSLIWVLCEAVRLSREHCDAMTQGGKPFYGTSRQFNSLESR